MVRASAADESIRPSASAHGSNNCCANRKRTRSEATTSLVTRCLTNQLNANNRRSPALHDRLVGLDLLSCNFQVESNANFTFHA